MAYDMPALQAHKEELIKYLKELKTQNAVEKENILKKVQGIKETEDAIEGLLAKNEKTITVLGSISTL